MTVPFTYLIFHVPTKKAYYGVRFAKGCLPSDLWTKYFTSSNRVKRLIDIYGKDSFVIKIRKTFIDRHDAVNWEQKVLKRINLKNGKWLNTMVTRNTFVNTTDNMNFLWSQESYRNNQTISQNKTWSNPELRKKHSEIMKSNWTEERKKIHSEKAKKQWENVDRIEMSKKMRDGIKNRTKIPKKIQSRIYKIIFYDGNEVVTDDLKPYCKSIGAKYNTVHKGFLLKKHVPKHNIKSIELSFI